MAPQDESSNKRAKLQHQASSSLSAYQILILFLLLSLYLGQKSLPASSQLDGKTSFASSSSSSSSFGSAQKGGHSKTSNNPSSSFSFREHIVHLQRKQQQQQPTQQVIEQRQQQQVVEQQFVQQQQPVEQQQRVVVEQSIDRQEQQQSIEQSSSKSSSYGSIKGTPGVDFPAYTSIPNTQFSCAGAPFDPGMYADETTGCQVYHLCYQGRRESFLCGEGTVFNQAIMNCDFWHSVDCAKSSSYYSLNAEFGKSSSEPGAGGTKSSSSSIFQQRVLQAVQLPQPPVQRATSFELEEQTYAGGTKGGVVGTQVVRSNFQSDKQPAPSSSSMRDYQQFSSQRRLAKQQRPLSPSRRANQLGVGQDQSHFSSAESSPMKSISATNKGVEQVGSFLTVTNELVDETATKGATSIDSSSSFSSSRKGSTGSTKDQVHTVEGSKKQADGKTSDLTETGRKVANEDTNDVWKPYFRSKTKTSQGSAGKSSSGGGSSSKGRANQSQPKNPSLTGGGKSTGASKTFAPPSASTTTGRPSTVAQPDQEPNFGNGASTTPESSTTKDEPKGETTESPKIPKSGPPPAEVDSTTEQTGTTSTTAGPTAAIEPDVGQALSSTAPAGADSSSSPPTEAPTTTTTAEPASSSTTESPPQTTTTAASPATETAAANVPTTTSTESPPATTTTTTAAPPTTTTKTPAAPSESSTPAGEGGEKEESSAESEMKKKRRGTLTAGVEYANESTTTRTKKKKKSKSKQVAARTNSSSVEYATG